MNTFGTGSPSRKMRRRLGLAVLQMGLIHTALAQAPEPMAAQPQTRAADPDPAAGNDKQAYGEQQAQWLLNMLQAHRAPATGGALEAMRQRIAKAVIDHPDARAATAAVSGARASTRETQSAARPQLDLDAETGYRKTDPSTINLNPERRYETGSVGLTLRQSLYDFGANAAAVAASSEFAVGVAARADGRRGDLALRGVQAMAELQRGRSLLDLARINVQAREEMVAFLSSRHELGGGSVSDVWRAQSRLADARGALAQTVARDRSNEANYREIFGQAPDDSITVPLPPPQDTGPLQQSPSAAVQSFAALRGAQAALRTAEQEFEATVRRDKPSVNLQLGMQRRDVVGRGTPGTDWQASVVMRHSFYSGGGDDARVEQARARIAEAAEQVRNTQIQLERSLLQALNDDAIGDELLAARLDGVRLAVDALRGVREQFAYRRGSLLDLMNAQDVLHAAGLAWVDAQVNQVLAKWRVTYFSDALMPWLGLPAYTEIGNNGTPAPTPTPAQ